jgi:D-sedoheptulose 7-phosphate isomerase
MNKNFFKNYYKDIHKILNAQEETELLKVVDMIATVKKSGKKVILSGNGGSASIAAHLAVDLTKAAKVRAINFNEANLITCFANDFGYENWLSEAMLAYADLGDLAILISSSGNSKNIVNAAKICQKKGVKLVTFTGFSEQNHLRGLGDIDIWVNSALYNIVEMTHHIFLLAITDYLIELERDK